MATTNDTVLTRRDLRRAVRDLVGSLGSNPGAIASSLIRMQVRGTPKSLNDCALARYLQVVIGSEPTITRISVSRRAAHVSRSGRHFDLTFKLPPSVSTFIAAFDSGGYPELVDRPAPSLRKPSKAL
jgi:hypothetical protein